MFVYGDYKDIDTLEGLYEFSRTKKGEFGPVVTKVFEKTDKFINEKNVHVVLWHKNFLHAFLNMLSYILFYHKKNNNSYFIIVLGIDVHEGDLEIPHAKFILNLLKDMNIRHKLIDIKETSFIVENPKYTVHIPFESSFLSILDEYCEQFNNSKDIPTEIIYLARSKVPEKNKGIFIKGRDIETLTIKSDLRILDEEVLIEYFKNNGVKIIYPEDFNSFEDQVKLMRGVKIMICPSGSGMANMIFMKNGGIVIELQTPVVVEELQQVHPFYVAFAWAKSHNFITVPHERFSDIIISQFNKRKFLEFL